MPDGRKVISYTTMIDTINRLYSEIGYSHRVTGKSAKYLGVSTAFARGLTNDEIRLLGRWKSCETPQHYRQVDPGRLHRISCVMNLVIASDNPVESSLSLTLSSTTRPTTPQQIVPEQVQCPVQPPPPSSQEDILVPAVQPWSLPLFSGPKWELCPFTGRFFPPLCPANSRKMRAFRPAAPFCPPRMVQTVLPQNPLMCRPFIGVQPLMTSQLSNIVNQQQRVVPQLVRNTGFTTPVQKIQVPCNPSEGLWHTTIEFPVLQPGMQQQSEFLIRNPSPILMQGNF